MSILMVLWTIAEFHSIGESVSPNELQVQTGLSGPTVHRALNKLMDMELVERVEHGQYKVWPTNPAFQVLAAVALVTEIEDV